MRADMDRVVIERPRWGSGLRNREVRTQRAAWRAAVARGDFDGEATRVRMVPRRGPCKGLTDLLGPLERFLEQRRGRLWDEVYSEIRQVLRPDSLLRKHALDHLVEMVSQHVFLDRDGIPWVYVGGWWPVGRWIVHPVTRRLEDPARDRPLGTRARAIRRLRRRPRPALQVFARVPGSDRLWLQLASGWVVVRLADDDGHDALFDRPAAEVPQGERVAVYGDATLRAVTCRSVGRRARRARGLA